MAHHSTKKMKDGVHATSAAAQPLPGQVVLVLQGGGAIGAYQVGVYQALHEAGIEPDRVIGTSIGAINAALIAGNPPAARLARLQEFWRRVEQRGLSLPGTGHTMATLTALTQGVPAFFSPNPVAWCGINAAVGIEQASYYLTDPLKKTLESLVDFEGLGARSVRLTVSAVNANTGEMRYFDSREEALGVDHILASGALPPAFPAVRIDGEPYWDGGIFSNTPIEAVLNDKPRHDSVIFTVEMWNPSGPEPQSLWQVMGRQKDIQFASRDSNIERQRQIHRMRHVIRELTRHLPAKVASSVECRELAAWGCGTTMHVIKLMAPRLDNEDYTRDIDFSSAGIAARRQSGYDETVAMLARKPWTVALDPVEGMMIHEAV